MSEQATLEQLRAQIKALVQQYGALASVPRPFEPGVTVVPPRDDLRALEGYHSAQVDVRVRLNSNESPLPPPAAWRDALAAEMSRIDWNRYPDRAATALREAIAEQHGVEPGQVFAAQSGSRMVTPPIFSPASAKLMAMR